jgi:hypothetical protein
MANMDNLNTVATVNRLLSLSYRHVDAGYLLNVTRLGLSIRGISGTHGKKDWHGDTGSAGSVRFWKKELNSMRHLEHLELSNSMTDNEELKFSGLEHSDPKACILNWLLPGLVLKQLLTLRLCDFVLDKATTEDTLAGHWPKLEKLTLNHVQLMRRGNLYTSGDSPTEHLRGQSWVEMCRILAAKQRGLCIELNRAVSVENDVERHWLDPQYIEELQGIPGVILSRITPRA